MVKTTRCYQRLGGRYVRFFGIFSALVGITFLIWGISRLFLPKTPFRTNILLVGSPMMVVSYDASGEHAVVITIPADTVISGITGVGQYSLESLWKLGIIDRNRQHILLDSLSEVLAIPIDGSIGPKGQDIPSQADGGSTIRATFSYGGLVKHIFGSTVSIPFDRYSFLIFATKSMRNDAFTYIDLLHSKALVLKDQADGTVIPTFDEAAFDVLLGTALEEDAIRKESLRVAVFNTTTTPTLGARVERKINKTGALVVELGNDTPLVDTCIVSGDAHVLKSSTVAFFVNIYGCESNNSQANARADIELRVGSDFERRFVSP